MLFLLIFPSFVWLFCLFVIFDAVAVVVFRYSRFVSLFQRCTDVYVLRRIDGFDERSRTYLHKSGTRANERTSERTLTATAPTQSFMFMYYFDPHSIFMIDCSMAFLFDFVLLQPLSPQQCWVLSCSFHQNPIYCVMIPIIKIKLCRFYDQKMTYTSFTSNKFEQNRK